jgi:hypothetical protein
MLARHGQRLSSCSLFVLSCQACSHRRNNVEYFGDWLWITFLDSRGAMPWKAIIWCTVAVVLMTPFVILNSFVRCTPSAPGSYYFDVGSKILKQVQDDGVWHDGVWHDGGWTSGLSGRGRPVFVPSCLCARYIGAAFGFGGAVCSRAMGEGPPGSPFCSFWGISYVSP